MKVLTTGKKKLLKVQKSRQILDDPDPLFLNYFSFDFHDNNQTDGSFAENSYILSRTTHGKFLITFC